ncbi:MAG: class I tRNA ligase family protein [Candidatus Chromulinivorax sp.]|nr:class I tRNA ligase family protein [Candidatus Chromulinivorax sp.]
MKKLYLAAALLCIDSINLEASKSFVLSSPLLRAADNAGVFYAPIVDILQTRIDIVNLIQGLKDWVGAILTVKIADTDKILTIYCRRPEIICGATFIAISPDHELAATIATSEYKQAVLNYIQKHLSKSLFDRQMSSTNDAVFTGVFAINPFTQELLPIYISEYAIECFDIRSSKTRLGVPAHNSKDLDFARKHNLPIKIVVDVQRNIRGKHDDLGPVCAAPLLDKQGNLTQAYLGEYGACVVTNSGTLNDLSLKNAAAYVIDYLEKNNSGCAHTQVLQYRHNNQLYSIKDLAKIETAIYKNSTQCSQINELKKEIKIILNYAQADFLEIGEKFLINVENMKSLMVALIYESCELRANNDCYLMQWAQLKGDVNAKEVFRRDITTLKGFTIFCKDLVNFLGDFVHSCPKAYENIRSQNQ